LQLPPTREAAIVEELAQRYCPLNDSLGDLTTACWGLTLLRANLWCPFHALFT